ncbi:Clavaminate synthase-like protein [Auriculariales sp. MPI-PUGE-AT-0066]|nr:Clavaminate synthase-like protein [Auriculariales sp. MPI-PUGE-AT-0066]
MTSLLEAYEEADSHFDAIPVIDLEHATSPDFEKRRAIADAIRDACLRVGFFYIKNHGIDESLISTCIDSSKQFFDLPLPTKEAMDIRKSPNYKGYTGLLTENTDPEHGAGDMHEAFEWGYEDIDRQSDDVVREDGAMKGANVWPSEQDVPGFRLSLLNYYHAAVQLGLSLFPLLALALNQPEDFFADKTLHPAAIMRVLHYPPQTGEMDDRVIGIGAHTDYECFTILWQDNVGGLQVLNGEGKWIQAPPIPGTFVVNLGDQLARWTNDVFKSTRHRAINRSGVRRYSIPLFYGTDYNVLLEPIPSCVSKEHPPKYEVVKAGDYVKSRLAATYH